MKIISIHNYYQTRGGEDQLYEDEVELLESKGHDVIRHTIHSDSISKSKLVKIAAQTLWNRESYKKLTDLISEARPDIIHAVNTFPLFSPSIFHAARKQNIPFVATIQNYRYFCAQAMCFRDGKACEACLGKLPWRAVTNRCYRGSVLGSAVVASMQVLHQKMRSWNDYIDVICVASEFSKSKLAKAGIPQDRMIIKPNFVPTDPGARDGKGGYAVFVGRLADEKGLETLVKAWRKLHSKGDSIPLKVVGDGPDSETVRCLANDLENVQWLGRVPNEKVYEVVGDAACLIFPSTGYESMPKTLIESMAVGTPVIGADIGSLTEVVTEDVTGSLFPVGDPDGLAAAVEKFFALQDKYPEMRKACRQQFVDRFTAEANYLQLIQIYQEAIRRRATGHLTSPAKGTGVENFKLAD